MSVNSSSSADPSLLPPHLTSSNSSILPFTCFRSKESILIFGALSITNFLLLPLFILVLYLGYQRWRQQRSTSSAVTHSDLFLYHSICMQLIAFLGVTIFFSGGYVSLREMSLAGLHIWSITFFGQALLHLLTCVERYLAVIKPITYLSLRQAGGVRIRNISIACVWLLCCGSTAVLMKTSYKVNRILHYFTLGFFLLVISFCSIKVLCALKRPGPGEVGGKRQRVDQSKQRASFTIMATLGALLLRFGGNLIGHVIYNAAVWSPSDKCVMFLCVIWFDLPSGLVLPLMFLPGVQKLRCCEQTTESE